MFQQSSRSSRQMTLPSAHWLESEIDSFPRVSPCCSRSLPSLPDFNSKMSPKSSTPLRCLPQLYLVTYLSYWKGFLVGLPASFRASFPQPILWHKATTVLRVCEFEHIWPCVSDICSHPTPHSPGPGAWASSQVFRCYKSFSILWIAILLPGMCVSSF